MERQHIKEETLKNTTVTRTRTRTRTACSGCTKNCHGTSVTVSEDDASFTVQIVNLTNYPINVYDDSGLCRVASFPPSGIQPQVVETSDSDSERAISLTTDNIHSATIRFSNRAEVRNMPAEEDGKLFVVNASVARTLAGTRSDLLLQGEFVYSHGKRIVGCKGLVIAG